MQIPIHPDEDQSMSGGKLAIDYTGCTNLIIVCCHAIFLGSALEDPYDESLWALQSFQKGSTTRPGEHETFLQHATTGLQLLRHGSWKGRSILVFSGGRTKPEVTVLSEARSYLNALFANADSKAYAEEALASKIILLEEIATDSYQNLLFSVVRFRQHVGRYPEYIRIITHAFKARRFLELHAEAIRWPAHRLTIHGIDPPMSQQERLSTTSGEEVLGIRPWREDPFGTGALLNSKRAARGWSETRLAEYSAGLEKSVQTLLLHASRDKASKATERDPLPWDTSARSSEQRDRLGEHA